MGVDGSLHVARARFHLGHKPQKVGLIIGFRESLAVHQSAGFQVLGGVQKAVGGDQVHAWAGLPSLQQHLEHAGGGGLAHGHGATHADDVGNLGILLTEEDRRGFVEQTVRLHAQVNQAGEGEIDLGDLFEIDLLADAAQLFEVVFREHLGHGLAQLLPLAASQLNIGADRGVRIASRSAGIHRGFFFGETRRHRWGLRHADHCAPSLRAC